MAIESEMDGSYQGDFQEPFHGAKLALFVGDALAVILRDMRADIPWPGHWDFPGGGREGDESPLDCALRETREELGLSVPKQAVIWGRRFEDALGGKWFFVAHLPAACRDDIKLGDEGQSWRLMRPKTYCAHPLAIGPLAQRLSKYLGQEAPRQRSGGR